MGFHRVRDIIDTCYDGGKEWTSSFNKLTANVSAQGQWIDWSMATGNPKPNFYATAPLISANLTDITAVDLNDRIGGIYTGGNVIPATKHLHRVQMIAPSASVAPALFYLVDYLMYYPFIDMDDTGDQIMTNTASLQRYTDGVGVHAFMVATNPYVGGAYYQITYRNQDNDVRTSAPMLSNTATTIGTIINSGAVAGITGAPFIQLSPGDTGIRRVESVTFISPNGGLACLVLCKVLATIYLKEATACSETDFIVDRKNPIRIYDGAYLNFLCCPNGSVAAVPIKGLVSTIWK